MFLFDTFSMSRIRGRYHNFVVTFQQQLLLEVNCHLSTVCLQSQIRQIELLLRNLNTATRESDVWGLFTNEKNFNNSEIRF